MMHNERGLTIVEVLMSLAISMAIFAAVSYQFAYISRTNRDSQIKVVADRQARTLVNLIGFDIRFTGNGIPFDQPDFEILEGHAALSSNAGMTDASDVIEPIKLSTIDDDNITLRINESGTMYMITTGGGITPASDLSMTLASAEGIEEDDMLYITNGSVANNDGFYGVVDSVDTGSGEVVFGSYVSSAGAVFPDGSLVAKVKEITYTNTTVAYNGENVPAITRTVSKANGAGAVTNLLARNATFSLRYLDYSGNPITLGASSPKMTKNQLADELAMIEVTVTVYGRKPLSVDNDENGVADVFSTSLTQVFSVRNLNVIHGT